MNCIINIPQEAYDLIIGKINTANLDLYSTLIQSVKNGTPIPDNTTNGDVVKKVFGNVPFYHDEWWNAPYKKGYEE